MAPKHRDGDTVAVIPGQFVSHAHTLFAYSAFLGALFVGVSLHYTKIVQNEHFGYPTEWFPSVSSTIGDRYPERSVFQLFIAMTSGPRFLLVFLYYLLTNRPGSAAAKWVAGVGVFRTLTCGGWTYVTSTDDHNWHDYFMVSYLVASIPWTLGCLALSPPSNARTVWWRKWLAGGFFGTLVPMLYFFIQHKVHRVPGAYTIYALFEWCLVLLDVGFDAVTALDFQSLEIVIKDVKGLSRGDNKRAQDTFLETQKDKPIGQVFDTKFQWNEMLDAFIFWSVLTSLGLVCWYFPLWHMGLSGYEIAIMSSVSPVLLGIPAFRRHIAHAMPGSYLLMGLAGLFAYLVTLPEFRLAAVSVGVWTGCLGLVGTLWRDRGDAAKLEVRRLIARINAWAIGLIASSIAKFAFWTNNPVWPIMNAENGGWNKTGIALFLVAIGRLYLRKPAMAANASATPKQEKPARGASALASLGFGGLMFALHYLLSDSSTIILWTWSGYPVRGPLAVPHGAWTIATMGLGLMGGLFYPNLARSWTAFGIGS
ncbi:hypothetical protein B0A55_09714, partial [Friedmanniomyces simplex]